MPSRPSDAAALTALAPEALGAWSSVVAALPGAIDADRLAALAGTVTPLLHAEPTDVPVATDTDTDTVELDAPVRRFVEQFVVDVSAVDDETRAAALSALGVDAFPFVQSLYVVDLGTRIGAAWRRLFGVVVPSPDPSEAELWPTLEAAMRAIARLDALDPVTTEIVRLRGARAHDCRLCRSLRNVRAAEAGTDETTYDQIDHYEQSGLPERHRVALRLVDAMIWQPTAYPDGLASSVAEHFTPAQTVELVLDVARNAANKIAVAFAADDPHVPDGVEFYDVDADGELVYGLTPRV